MLNMEYILDASIIFVAIICFPISVMTSTGLPGHMQPLGSHMEPIEIESRDDMPNPVEFYKNYVKPGKPLILRGAAKDLPNFENWKDDQYLRQNFGKWKVAYEIGKREDSNKKDRPTNISSFGNFLDIYKDEEVYLVQYATSDNPLVGDVAVPKCLACGGYISQIGTIPIFFSSGGTNTAVHYDDYNNLSCMFDGSKEWITFDRKTFPYKYMDGAIEGYSGLNTLEVNMTKYPELQHLPWYHGIVNTGDCIFLPLKWPHHVLSDKRRNMGVSVWWSHMHELNISDCPENLNELPNYSMVASFEGGTLRNAARETFLHMFIDNKKEYTKNEFLDYFMLMRNLTEEEAEEMLEDVDLNEDDIITEEEVLSNDFKFVEDVPNDEFENYQEDKYKNNGQESKEEL